MLNTAHPYHSVCSRHYPTGGRTFLVSNQERCGRFLWSIGSPRDDLPRSALGRGKGAAIHFARQSCEQHMLIRQARNRLRNAWRPEPRPLDTIESLLRGRSVALVGNAASLLQKHRNIDDHDVVVRINRGPFVPDPEKRAGSRTDILLISTFEGGQDYLGAAPHVIWMTPRFRDEISRSRLRRLYFYPEPWWVELSQCVGARPSTGCMGIDLISKLIAPGELYLYGFDFWRTHTTYQGSNRPGPHNPAREEEFARSKVKAENIVI
jgi:hypothetical protein